MTVTAHRVVPCRELMALIETVLSDPVSLAAMPEPQRCAAWRRELFLRFAAETAFAYVPFGPAANPLGLYWAELCGAGAAFCHQFLLPEARRGLTCVFAARACARALAHDFPGVRVLMGLTPEDNRAAVLAARRAGFRDAGRADGCRLMVADRSVFG